MGSVASAEMYFLYFPITNNFFIRKFSQKNQWIYEKYFYMKNEFLLHYFSSYDKQTLIICENLRIKLETNRES